MVAGVGKRILIIVGPTAAGKSALAVQTARLVGAEIVSADSRQVYRELTIGTAKPTVSEREGIPHHLLDCLPVSHPYNAGMYAHDADAAIEGIIARGRSVIVAGGSGLYIRALVDGFFEGPGETNEVRELLYDRIRSEGAEVVLDELRRVDPEIARTMNPRTVHRIVRALEVFELTGIPLSHHHSMQTRKEIYDPLFLGIEWERSALYRRIDARVDAMLREGLIDEVRRLAALGFDETTPALRTVGYREVFPFLRGDYDDSEMARLIKRNSRRYAKRQMTWFRRDPRIRWHRLNDENETGSLAQTLADEFNAFLRK